MSVITSIKQQKDKSRVNIYFDGKFGFGLDLENFVKLNLKIEQELTVEEIEKIKNKADFQKTFAKLLNFATIRPRSEKEIKDWFWRKKVPENYYKKLFDKLKHFELIDDDKFAKWWLDSRIQFRHKSKRELIFELRKKGIDKEIIEKTLADVGIDEIKTARELVNKKIYKWEKLKNDQKKKKITEFLGRRGFGWEIIKKVIG